MSKTFSTENSAVQPPDPLAKTIFVEKVMSRLWTFDEHVIAEDDLIRLRADAERMFDSGRWSVEDASALLRCTEEVTSSLSEELALKRMKVLTDKNGMY
jgi:hypothetical protein